MCYTSLFVRLTATSLSSAVAGDCAGVFVTETKGVWLRHVTNTVNEETAGVVGGRAEGPLLQTIRINNEVAGGRDGFTSGFSSDIPSIYLLRYLIRIKQYLLGYFMALTMQILHLNGYYNYYLSGSAPSHTN